MAGEKNNFVGDGFLQYLYVLDSSYKIKCVIDTFSDFLWTERYYGYGEFEITIPMKIEILEMCHLRDYVSIRESDKIMIVETMITHSDPMNGDTLIISGRSLESILDRRVILEDRVGTTNVHSAIKALINNSITSPSSSVRTISNFVFKDSDDPKVTGLTMEAAIENKGETVYKQIESICREKNLGFKVDGTDNGGYQFELYFGVDRSWDQIDIPPVVFSDSYENLKDSNYLDSEQDSRSCVYVESYYDYTWYTTETDPDTGMTIRTEHTETQYRTDEVYKGAQPTGLNRRESYMNAGEYTSSSSIRQKGLEYLADYKAKKLFEGETEFSRQFIFGQDYFLGDVVQLENQYKQTGKCRVIEIVMSRNASGPSMVPTFETVEEE